MILPQKILNILAYTIQKGYDILFCNKILLRKKSREIRPLSKLKISVAIPNYNRGHQIHRALNNIINSTIVDEIVILDDCSEEKNYNQLVSFINTLSVDKIRVYRNEKNCKALVAKRKSVELCKNDWVLVLDSDNTAFISYLKSISKIKHLEDNTIYCPSTAFPHYSFRKIGFKPIDFDRACELATEGTLSKVYFFNDGNYLVPRIKYLEISTVIGNPENDSADVMLLNYFWVSNGGKLQILENTSYMHRIENTSRWLNNPIQSKSRVQQIINNLKKGVRSDNYTA
jgi:glycosyltransferase involved in cell wall biosynthesis